MKPTREMLDRLRGRQVKAWLSQLPAGVMAELQRPLGTRQHLMPPYESPWRNDERTPHRMHQEELKLRASNPAAWRGAPLSAGAAGALLSPQGLDDPDDGWQLAPEDPGDHLLALAGQRRPIDLPAELRLTHLDLMLLGVALPALSPIDLAGISWLCTLPRARATSPASSPADLTLQQALAEDLWAGLLPNGCMPEAAQSAHRSLQGYLGELPGSGSEEERSWQDCSWNPRAGNILEALPTSFQLKDARMKVAFGRLLKQLSLGELETRGRRSVPELKESKEGGIESATLSWAPWPFPIPGLDQPRLLVMLVLPNEGTLGQQPPSVSVELALVEHPRL